MHAGVQLTLARQHSAVRVIRAQEGMYLLGSSAALQHAADKGAAAGRPCMWSQVLEQLEQEGVLGKSLQVWQPARWQHQHALPGRCKCTSHSAACAHAQVRCQRHGVVTDITHPQQFRTLVGDGGCQLACGLKLPCGHTCPRRCHADDAEHTQVGAHGHVSTCLSRAAAVVVAAGAVKTQQQQHNQCARCCCRRRCASSHAAGCAHAAATRASASATSPVTRAWCWRRRWSCPAATWPRTCPATSECLQHASRGGCSCSSTCSGSTSRAQACA